MNRKFLGCIIMTLVWACPLAAEITLPSVIGENMVFQRDADICLWGWADPGENVTVSVDTKSLAATTDINGEWKVVCGPLKPGGPIEVTFKGKNKITLSNVLVGDVWVCSGQSNMEMMVQHCDDPVNEVAQAFYPKIRLFQIKNSVAAEPQKDCEAQWELCRPGTVGNFSATGYYFGREIMRELDVPVGLIHASWGGSAVELWMSGETIETHPDMKKIHDSWKPVIRDKKDEILDYYRVMGDWMEDLYYSLATYGYTPPIEDVFKAYNGSIDPPESPVPIVQVPSIPSWIHNAMISPLVRYGIKGAIWYQGESNAGRAYQYRTLFPMLINDWRKQWGQGDFPFLFVQIANYMMSDSQPQESGWAELREAQLMTLSLPNTAMAVTIDIGNPVDIHPRNKQEVGRRLALGALKVAYGKDIVHSGPLYKSMSVADSKIRIKFTHSGSGLISQAGETVEGFAIAGDDRRFVWAKAVLKDNEVEVWNDGIQNPVAVRYGWGNNPACSLFNKEGLPASPFRTDDWPGVTADAK